MDREDGTTKTRDNAGVDAGIDQAEAYANDPANASPRFDLKSVAKSRKTMVAGGAAGLIALMIAGTLALLPLKLEAFMKNIFQQRVGDKVEHVMERRAEKMVIRALMQSGAKDGTYHNGVLLTSLYANWRLKGFEAKFADKSGIKLEAIKGGGIRLTTPDGQVKSSYNEADFKAFLDKGDLKGRDARKFIRQVTRAETRWVQVYKRAHLRKYMRNAYGIRKWSWFTGKEGKEGATDLNNRLIDTAGERSDRDAGRALGCALDGKGCPNDNSTRDAPYGEADTSPPKASTSDDSVKDSTSSSLKSAREEAKKLSPDELAKNGLSQILAKYISQNLASKIASKAIPIVGQILLFDQISRIDHFFEEGDADKTLRAIHKSQYAAQFATFLSIVDNSKDPEKNMSGDEFNAVMSKFGGDEAQSAAFQEVFLGESGGTKLDGNLGVDDKATPIKDDYNKFFPNYSPMVIGLRAWYDFANATYVSKVIDAANFIIGGIVGTAVELALKPLEAIVHGLKSLLATIGEQGAKVLLKVVRPAVDGTERDADLFNSIDAGGAVVGQDYMKSLGGHELKVADILERNRSIAYNKSLLKPNLYNQFFSTEYAPSVVNRLAVIVPQSPIHAATQMTDYSLAVIKNPLGIFDHVFRMITGKVNADSGQNLYGLKEYGYTEDELDQELEVPDDHNKDGKIDKEDCKYNKDGSKIENFDDLSTGRLCLLDLSVVESMRSVFTDEDDGGIDSGSTGETTDTPTAVQGLTGDLPTGTAQQLAAGLLNNPRVIKSGRLVTSDLQATAAGKVGSSGAPLSQTLLAILTKLAESHSYDISALESGGTGHSSTSLHYTGDAVDFRAFNGKETNGRDAASIGLLNALAPILPSGSGVGQVNCPGGKPALPPTVAQFEDTCTHVHVQIPRGSQ